MRVPSIVRAMVVAAACSVTAPRTDAQIPYHVFNDQTEVRSINFRFTNTRTLDEKDLRRQIVLMDDAWFARVQDLFSFLPGVSEPPPNPFTPLELQRDVARLRRFYQQSGFLGTQISYDVSFDNDNNRVRVDFVIDEGRAITLQSVAIELADGTTPADRIPEDLRSSWENVAATADDAVGERFTAAERTRATGAVLDWWRNNGWAFSQATVHTTVDSAQAALALRIELDPGPRTRVDSIVVTGNESVERRLILRTLPVSVGDWYSAHDLAVGQRRLLGLELFRLALVDVPEDQPRDSTVTVRVRLEEAPPRLVTGEVGYISEGGGVTGRAEFAHRNFTGGARTLRTSAVAQTGYLASGGIPDELYQLTVSYREPLFFDPRLSLTIAPFGLYRDNSTDRSSQLGVETTLIYALGAFEYITLQHRYSTRRVFDYRFGSGSTIDLETLLALAAEGALDTIGPRIERSAIGLSATIGRFDPTRPVPGLNLRPTVEVTTPPALNTIEFTRAELPLAGYRPLTRRIGIAASARVGRVFPFGKTLVGDSIGAVEQVRLRDVLLTAGGTGSVRGWGNGLLGPKVLNLRLRRVEGTDSIVAVGTEGYIPAGGLARATFATEIRLPFPGLNESWGTHVFFDGGRVWSPGSQLRREETDEERWFYSTGAGIDAKTIVGPVRLSVGYKLNPSVLDVRRARAVFEALAEGRPATSIPGERGRRWHLHLSLGQAF